MRDCAHRLSDYVFSCGNEDIDKATFIPINLTCTSCEAFAHSPLLSFPIILRAPPTIILAPPSLFLAPPTILLTLPCKSECEAEEGLNQGPTA